MAKQQEFSRQQAALVASQIQQQQVVEQQVGKQWQEQQQLQQGQELLGKNETPAWLQAIITKQT